MKRRGHGIKRRETKSRWRRPKSDHFSSKSGATNDSKSGPRGHYRIPGVVFTTSRPCVAAPQARKFSSSLVASGSSPDGGGAAGPPRPGRAAVRYSFLFRSPFPPQRGGAPAGRPAPPSPTVLNPDLFSSPPEKRRWFSAVCVRLVFSHRSFCALCSFPPRAFSLLSVRLPRYPASSGRPERLRVSSPFTSHLRPGSSANAF